MKLNKKSNWMLFLFNVIVITLTLFLIGSDDIYTLSAIILTSNILLLRVTGYKDALFFCSLCVLISIDYDVTVQYRLWYAFYAVVLIYSLSRGHARFKISKGNLIPFFFVFYIFSFSIIWLMFGDFESKIANAKWNIFYVSVIVYFWSLDYSYEKLIEMLNFYVVFTSSIIFIGIAQFVCNLTLGFGNNFLYPNISNIEVRPVGFFSETTWLSECALILIITSIYLYNQFNKQFYLFCIGISSFVVVITSTRNTYFAIFVLFVFLFGTSFFIRRVKKIKIKYIMFVVLVFIFVFMNDSLFSMIDRVLERFTSISSSSGRIEAFNHSFLYFNLDFDSFFGRGFYWDPSFVAGNGTSLGAKSFNLFFMFQYIYGYVGLFWLLMTLFGVLYSNIVRFKEINKHELLYANYVLVAYVSMAMFAPLHLYPYGAFILIISLLFTKIANSKGCC